LRYRCYRGSLKATGAVTALQVVHRVLGTYRRVVAAHIALTEFAKRIMVRAGLPEDRVFVKPNFVVDPGGRPGPPRRPTRVVYVGRLVHEKGVDILIDAWRRRAPGGAELLIIGDGPERRPLEAQATGRADIQWLGWLPRQGVVDALRDCAYLVLPSRWYEGLPLVMLEAFASGTPVVAPRWGGVGEVVADGVNGALFEPLDARSLAETLARCLRLDSAAWQRLSDGARAAYETRYARDGNYRALVAIYERVCGGPAHSPATEGS
jgi:glycosyltransferase involved in cell wall biosynthesis